MTHEDRAHNLAVDITHDTLDFAEIKALIAQALRATWEEAEQVVNEEPELPGRMPPEIWAAIHGDQDATEEAMRIVVRKTKDNIAAALRQRGLGEMEDV